MTPREEIAAIVADGTSNKPARIALLKAQRLHGRLQANLPYIWQPRASVVVTIKGAEVQGSAIAFVIDVTIKGVTKTLSEWIEGKKSTPDWRIINPPLFVDDPAGDVTITQTKPDGSTVTRTGRDDSAAAMRSAFVDAFGVKIAALVRAQ